MYNIRVYTLKLLTFLFCFFTTRKRSNKNKKCYRRINKRHNVYRRTYSRVAFVGKRWDYMAVKTCNFHLISFFGRLYYILVICCLYPTHESSACAKKHARLRCLFYVFFVLYFSFERTDDGHKSPEKRKKNKKLAGFFWVCKERKKAISRPNRTTKEGRARWIDT